MSWMDFYQASMDSIREQDEWYAFLRAGGLLADGPRTLTDETARAKLEQILSLTLKRREKYALLHVLDVAIQSHGVRGIASPVISEILAAQYNLLVEER